MFFSRLTPVLLAGLLALTACQKDPSPQPDLSDLTGTWQLTKHQCYCAPAPLANEQVIFTSSSFTFLRDGLPVSSGTYSFTASANLCGGGPAGPALHLQPHSGIDRVTRYTFSANTLTLDYGGPCDAPVDTYERVPL